MAVDELDEGSCEKTVPCLLRAPVASPRLATPLAPRPRAARPGAVDLPAIAGPEMTTCRRHRLQLNRRPVPRTVLLGSGVDPDAKMPDNAREFGPRGRLVRVRRRGCVAKLRPAPHRSSLRCRPAIRPRPRQRRRGRRGRQDPTMGKGTTRDGRRTPPQTRIARRGGTGQETSAGTDGRRFATTGSRRAERRWEPYNGKENDSFKSAANRRNPVL